MAQAIVRVDRRDGISERIPESSPEFRSTIRRLAAIREQSEGELEAALRDTVGNPVGLHTCGFSYYLVNE